MVKEARVEELAGYLSTIHRNIQKQLYDNLDDTPTERANLLSQSTSHTGARDRDRGFRVSVVRRLMLPHPAASNAVDVVQSCAKKSAAGLICNKPVDLHLHHCSGCWYGGGVDRRHAAVARMPSRRDTLTQWHQTIH